MPKEIRVPKSFASIAGFTALARKTINIKDAYDAAELQRFHANLRFDQRWDKQTGFRTKAVLAVPILFEKYLLGVVQLINKRHGVGLHGAGRGCRRGDRAHSRHRVLQPAQRHARRPSRRSSACSIDKGVVSEKDLEAAVSNARDEQHHGREGADRGLQRAAARRSAGRCRRITRRRGSTTTARRRSPPISRTASPPTSGRSTARAGGAEAGHARRGRRRPAGPNAPRRHPGHEPRAALRVPGGHEARDPGVHRRRRTASKRSRTARRRRAPTGPRSSTPSAKARSVELDDRSATRTSRRSTRPTPAS